MLHFSIVASKTRNTPSSTNPSTNRASARTTPLDEVRPLNARSVALSVLLGSHPPELSARSLIRLAELFEINAGTMRTAISRLVRDGSLTQRDARYSLAGPMVERQRSQDAARREPSDDWSGLWHTVVAAEPQRQLAERRAFRATMHNHRFGELRPDIWMRPANEPAPPPAADIIITTGRLTGRRPHDLVAQLWDLDAFERAGTTLLTRTRDALDTLDWDNPSAIVPSFHLAAAIVRFLRAEPRLPLELRPPGSTVETLRISYDDLERRHQRILVEFLRAHDRDEAPNPVHGSARTAPADIVP